MTSSLTVALRAVRHALGAPRGPAVRAALRVALHLTPAVELCGARLASRLLLGALAIGAGGARLGRRRRRRVLALQPGAEVDVRTPLAVAALRGAGRGGGGGAHHARAALQFALQLRRHRHSGSRVRQIFSN